jgi:membrane protease YdiL (CAAX protease family)
VRSPAPAPSTAIVAGRRVLVVDPAHRAALTAAFLLAGLALAVGLRIVLLRLPDATAAQGLAFGGALLLLAVAAGSRTPAMSRSVIVAGLAGGAILLAVPMALSLLSHGSLAGPVLAANGGLSAPAWVVVTLVVACGEEALLRGALFRACLPALGTVGTVVLTSAAFALMHLPFYGWAAIPLDLAVGVWLGGLRVASGSAAAPAVAHTLADLAAWWL